MCVDEGKRRGGRHFNFTFVTKPENCNQTRNLSDSDRESRTISEGPSAGCCSNTDDGHIFGQKFGETNPSGSLRALTLVRPTPLASGISDGDNIPAYQPDTHFYSLRPSRPLLASLSPPHPPPPLLLLHRPNRKHLRHLHLLPRHNPQRPTLPLNPCVKLETFQSTRPCNCLL